MSTFTRARSTRARAFAALLVVALAAAGCGAPTDEGVVYTTITAPTSPPTQGGTEPDPRPAETAPEPEPEPTPPAADFAAALPAGTGLAFAPVGGGEVQSHGTWSEGVAWSTIKVPLAIAALRAVPGSEANMGPAIRSSDNAAAQALWDSLGGGAAASGAVTAVLQEGGDTATVVPEVQLRPPYTVFGQSRWSLTNQAQFASRLPCIGGGESVYTAMGEIIPDQQWGLGLIPGTRFKGGWGPSETGGYLVRQFGVIPAAGGDVAVAIATDAPSFGDGTATLSNVVGQLSPALTALPGGSC